MGLILEARAYKPGEEKAARMEAEAAVRMEEDRVMAVVHMEEERDVVKDACRGVVSLGVWEAKIVRKVEVMVAVKVGLAVDASCHVMAFPHVGVVWDIHWEEVHMVVGMEVVLVVLAVDACHGTVFSGVEVVKGVHEVDGIMVEEMAVLKERSREVADTRHAAVSHGGEVVDDVCEAAGVLYGTEDMDAHERVVQVQEWGQGA